MNNRFWEIDAMRGVAIVMMVIYHFVYDLDYFDVTDVVYTDPFWFYFQRVTATIFIALVGISLAINNAKFIQQGINGRELFWMFLQRGTRIFAWGLVISLMTWLTLGAERAVRFGILHFIGTSIVLAFPFLKGRWSNVTLGLLLISAGRILQAQTFSFSWLFWLGFLPANHRSVDYFPLIPWFGAVLIGIAHGNTLYRDFRRQFSLPDLSHNLTLSLLQRMGRHSLVLYLIHQPLLFAGFILVSFSMSWVSRAFILSPLILCHTS